MQQLKYYIRTWGCQMNEHDSERYSGMFNQMGHSQVNKIKDADIVLFNTCCVRENAERKVLGNIGRLKHFRKQKPNLIIIVAGCMMQQPHVINIIEKDLSFVNLILGTYNIHRFPQLLEKVLAEKHSKRPLVEVWDQAKSVVEGIPSIRKFKFKAFVNIMYGCNNFCSYCIVPYTRGRERSRSKEAILKEISTLVNEGVLEITLLGQNVNSYGKDLYKEYDFSDLLGEIDKIDGIKRIRFMTSHPKDATEKLIDTIAASNNICENFHLPVQSGSNRILKKMNRHYTREQYLKFAAKLYSKIPDITLSTDIIIGFPDETDSDFYETLSLAKEVSFDNAYVFLYSKRSGTKAAESQSQIPENVKHERFDKIISELNAIAYRKNFDKVGNIETVLVDGISEKHPGSIHGRTRGNKIVTFKGDSSMIGTIVTVRILEAKRATLIGALC
ncbi:MAG TPA: tRNA (N6-isopentenyl adenosine(37)-C2)-methylthiotransferase MiaB [Clostridia bacterium]|nr:tRNA (N6-isopentenyl adenosine(37)-C2)-methylthiotransferase MiaB [Clostridia bacterium]